jgi:transposase
MSRKPYDSDTSDVEWLLLEPLIPPEKHGGRHRTVDIREVVNVIFYVLRTGRVWRLLPHDFSPWQTVYGYFREWCQTGVWQQLNAALRDAVREQEERQAELLLARALAHPFERLVLIWADGGYAGQTFCEWVLEHCGWLVEIVKRSDDAQGFVVLPRRWVVERTFGWLYRFRRLSKDEVWGKDDCVFDFVRLEGGKHG